MNHYRTYSALRPAVDADAERVQNALLSIERRDPDLVVGVAVALLLVLVAVLLITGVI